MQAGVSTIQNHVDDIEWSNSSRVDCLLCRYIHLMRSYCILAYHSKQNIDDIDWSDSRSVKTVGGLNYEYKEENSYTMLMWQKPKGHSIQKPKGHSIQFNGLVIF